MNWVEFNRIHPLCSLVLGFLVRSSPYMSIDSKNDLFILVFRTYVYLVFTDITPSNKVEINRP